MFRLWLSPQLLRPTPPPANNIPCRTNHVGCRGSKETRMNRPFAIDFFYDNTFPDDVTTAASLEARLLYCWHACTLQRLGTFQTAPANGEVVVVATETAGRRGGTGGQLSPLQLFPLWFPPLPADQAAAVLQRQHWSSGCWVTNANGQSTRLQPRIRQYSSRACSGT